MVEPPRAQTSVSELYPRSLAAIPGARNSPRPACPALAVAVLVRVREIAEQSNVTNLGSVCGFGCKRSRNLLMHKGN